MNSVILDSCSIINFINSNAIDSLILLKGYVFYLGELVYDECSESQEQKEVIDRLLINGDLSCIGDKITFNDFKQIKTNYELGDGESESIALAKKLNYIIATDDKKARSSSIKELGKNNLCGTLYLLKEMVSQEIITCDECLIIYKNMKIKGGFLPLVDVDYLCK